MKKIMLVGVLSLFLCGCSQYNANPRISNTTEQIIEKGFVVEDNTKKETDMRYKELTGSWAEKGAEWCVIFEINDNELTHLINGCVELRSTSFELNENGDFILPNSFLDYSHIKSCKYDNGKIVVTEENKNTDFKRTYELYPTEACRYGMVEIIDDEMLPQLQGRWEYGDLFLEFEGNILRYGINHIQENQLEIIVTRHLQVRDWVYICNKDPRETNVGKYPKLKIVDSKILAIGIFGDETDKYFAKVI